MKLANSSTLAILDNTLLESSMGSTQGLLTFMTDASKQIKTYLGEEEQQKKQKKQQQRNKMLLQQLSQLNTHGDFIPQIMNTPYSTSVASPTPSLDSTGSNDDTISTDDESIERPSCLMSRKRKIPSNVMSSLQECDLNKKMKFNSNFNQDILRIKQTPPFHQNTDFQFTCPMKPTTVNTTRRHYDVDLSNNYSTNFMPSPTPDFDDLVNCLTDDYITPIDISTYFNAIV